MKPGSLVTPRWNKNVMILRIIELAGDPWVVECINQLPEFGQIYTAKDVEHCDCGCNGCICWLEEVQVFKEEDIGLPGEFYVEVAPPEENVQEVMDSIQKEEQHKELMDAYYK